MRKSGAGVCVIVAFALYGCGGDAGGGGVVTDTIGGVPSVMSPDRGLLGDTLPWRVTQYLLVAGDQLFERKAADFALDAGILPNGNVVVLDAGNRRLLRFGADGEYIGFFGGPGQEPGQFVTPFFIEVAASRIYVVDSGLNRITAFDSAGIFLSRFQVDLAGLAGTAPLFAAGGDDELYVAAEPVPFLESARDTGLAVIYHFDMNGQIADTVASFPPSTWAHIEREEGQGTFIKARLAPTPRVSAAPGAVAMTLGARYLIELRRPDGSLLRRVARQYENVAVTPAIRDSILDALAAGPRGLPRASLELIPFAAVIPAIDDLVLDDRGRLWVKTYGDPTRHEIFDADGRFLGPLFLPQPVKLVDVRGERICGTIQGAGAQSAVVCYRLSERARG